ncbi:MAG: hypothetical protein F4Z82_09655 [Caldilineaceae bacterium SB0668_bin_21]|nr:hypothetical protein [Caldilineaceae bacterium SB0668_bin_21]MYC22086.1 hypothetical protein [Caldilineaceae bacterium SB0662_bin_25]
METTGESKPKQDDLNRKSGALKGLSKTEPTEESKVEREDSQSTETVLKDLSNAESVKESKAERDDSQGAVKVLKDLARIACAFIVLYGVMEGYNRFSLRYDDDVLENSIHQIFTVAESLGYVIISYCLARGIMILFNLDDRGK